MRLGAHAQHAMAHRAMYNSVVVSMALPSMAEQTHMAGQNCPIVQKEGFWDVQSNKQVLITGICCLQQFFGFWEIADRGLGLLLLWPLSLAFWEGFG